MATYRVTFTTTASATVRVEAEDEDAALEAAYGEVPSGVCAQCSGWGRPWSLDLGEFDIDDDPESGLKAVELVTE